MRCFSIYTTELTGRLDCYFNYAQKHNRLQSIFQKRPLFELVKSQTGGTPSKGKAEYWNGNIPWASPKDFKTFYLTDTEDHISEIGLNNSSTKLIPSNAVLVVVRSGILSHSLPVALTKKPMAINQDIRALIPNEELSAEFLAVYLSTFSKQLLPLITKHSTTVQSVNTDQFAKIQIPLPPLEAQNRMVSIMQSAYDQKKQKEQEAENLLNSIDDYVLGELGIKLPELQDRKYYAVTSEAVNERLDPYYYQQKFTDIILKLKTSKYECKSLEEITIFVTNGRTPNKDDYINEDKKGIPIIKARTASKKNVNLNKLGYVKNGYIGNQTVQKGDIFILSAAHQAEYVGKNVSLLNDFPKEDTYFVGELIGIRAAGNKCLSEYLFGFLSTKLAFILTNREKRGQTSHLYPDDLKRLQIPLPPLIIQHQIAKELIDRMTQAEKFKTEANALVEKAKQEAEAIILGNAK